MKTVFRKAIWFLLEKIFLHPRPLKAFCRHRKDKKSVGAKTREYREGGGVKQTKRQIPKLFPALFMLYAAWQQFFLQDEYSALFSKNLYRHVSAAADKIVHLLFHSHKKRK